jgi:hypothetical protein
MCVQGGNTDKESIGRLVWAPLPSNDNVMWPAEVLDAAKLPRGRSIPREALVSLNQTERTLLQQHVEMANPKGHSVERLLLEGLHSTKLTVAPVNSPPNEDSVGNGGAPVVTVASSSGKKGGTQKKGVNKRVGGGRQCNVPKVFVMFFGSSRWCWMSPDQLLDFQEHKECDPHKCLARHFFFHNLPHPLSAHGSRCCFLQTNFLAMSC